MYEVLDGQQRITSFARFVNQSWQFAVEIDGRPRYFDSLNKDKQDLIREAPLTIYVCEGEPSEIQEWFETINIAGVQLVKQELRNAAYHGSFVTKAREVFSNTGNSNMNRWQTYVKGDPKRQAILETALDWVSGGSIDDYMARHRYDKDINELKDYFDTVIDWVDSVFDYTEAKCADLNGDVCTGSTTETPIRRTGFPSVWILCLTTRRSLTRGEFSSISWAASVIHVF